MTDATTTAPTVLEVLIGVLIAVVVGAFVALMLSLVNPQCNAIRSMTSNFTNMNMTLPANVLGALNQSAALQTCMQGVKYG